MFAGSVALAQVAPPAPPATPEAVDDTSAPETPPPSQDIVVTAQKRAVSVTKVPTTIDVVSGEALQNLKVSSFDTLNGIVPSLSIERAAGGNVTMAIRGVGTTSAGQTLEQSVAAYINGVYMGGAIREFSTPLYDLERVEALSGTQSGIAGQNTSVGAINIVTRQPGNRFGGYVRVGHEFRYNGLNAEGALDLPLTEDLKVRVTGFADKTGGWLNNIVTGTRPGRGRVYSGRLNAVWTPASNVRVSLYGQYDNGFRIGTSYTTYNYPDYIPGIGNETTKVIASDPGRSPYDGEEYYKYDIYRGSLTVDIDLGGPTLTSVTAGTRIKDHLTVDLDQTSTQHLWFDQPMDYKQVHQEVRLTSPAGQAFNYIVGAWYRHANYDKVLTVTFDVDPFATNLFTATKPFNQVTDTYSAFTDLQYALTDKLKIGGTLRYTKETKAATIENISNWPSGVTPFGATPLTMTRLTPSFVDGSARAQYQATPSTMLYALYSRGTKTGATADLPSIVTTLVPEKAETYEIGAKFRSSASRITASAALFRMNLKNYQDIYSVATATGPQFIADNRNLYTEGLQFSSDWRPIQPVTLGLNGTVMKSADRTAGGDAVRVPTLSLSANARYDMPLETLRATLGVFTNVTYRSRYLNKPETVLSPTATDPRNRIDNANVAAFTRTPGYELVDLGVDLKHEDGLNVTFLIKNLTNTITHLSAEEMIEAPGHARGSTLPLRQFFLTFGYDF